LGARRGPQVPGVHPVDADEFRIADLRRWDDCLLATSSVDHVYALAADMGGMGFISSNHATILRNNALISLRTLEAARLQGASRWATTATSSACGRGWRASTTSTAPRHDDGGREQAPAALCRKVALAQPGDSIEIWGDGAQTRSFCYIDDCVEGIYRLMWSDHTEPLNIGSNELVTIDQLADRVIDVSGKPDLWLPSSATTPGSPPWAGAVLRREGAY